MVGLSSHSVFAAMENEIPEITDTLPSEMLVGATLRGREYGWSIESFPQALAAAKTLGYACLGGQFQFRIDDGSVCEMYWLGADPKDPVPGESWSDYCNRSGAEVFNSFQHLTSTADFRKEASSWPSISIDHAKT